MDRAIPLALAVVAALALTVGGGYGAQPTETRDDDGEFRVLALSADDRPHNLTLYVAERTSAGLVVAFENGTNRTFADATSPGDIPSDLRGEVVDVRPVEPRYAEQYRIEPNENVSVRIANVTESDRVAGVLVSTGGGEGVDRFTTWSATGPGCAVVEFDETSTRSSSGDCDDLDRRLPETATTYEGAANGTDAS